MNIEKFINDCKPEMKKYLHNIDTRFEDLADNEISIVFDEYSELYVNVRGKFKRFGVEKIDDINLSGTDPDNFVELLSKKIGETISKELIEDLIAELYTYEVNTDSFHFKSEGVTYMVQE